MMNTNGTLVLVISVLLIVGLVWAVIIGLF